MIKMALYLRTFILQLTLGGDVQFNVGIFFDESIHLTIPHGKFSIKVIPTVNHFSLGKSLF